MPRIPGFVGPSNRNLSLNADAERTINFFQEVIDAGTGKNRIVFHGTPGLRTFVQLPHGPIRSMFHQDGRAFVMAGGRFYELFTNQTYTARGSVQTSPDPGTIDSNGPGGDQLFLVSGRLGYTYDLTSNTLTQITDPEFPSSCTMGAFVDGYFIALKRFSAQFQISALEDGTSWDGLDIAQLSTSSNLIVSMAVRSRELWLFGSKTTEVWVNTGDAGFPFAPLSGTLIGHGILAPWSVQPLDNTLFWLGADDDGAGIVYRADGYKPTRISNHAVETALVNQPKLAETIGFTYQLGGHTCYVLYIPQSETHWVYDVSHGQWHEWASWNLLPIPHWESHVSRCHAYAFGKHLVGDRQSGAIYELRQDVYDEEVAVA